MVNFDDLQVDLCIEITPSQSTVQNKLKQYQQGSNQLVGSSNGLRELCSNFFSLFYSEFPLKSLHYAYFILLFLCS